MNKTAKELQAKSITQLSTDEINLRSEIAKLSIEFKVTAPKDVNAISKKKKRLAVLLTMINNKKQEEKLLEKVKTKK